MDAPAGGARPAVSHAGGLRIAAHLRGLLPADPLAGIEKSAGESRRGQARGNDSGAVSGAQDFDETAGRRFASDPAALARGATFDHAAIRRRFHALAARPAQLPTRGSMDGADQFGAFGAGAGAFAR